MSTLKDVAAAARAQQAAKVLVEALDAPGKKALEVLMGLDLGGRKRRRSRAKTGGEPKVAPPKKVLGKNPLPPRPVFPTRKVTKTVDEDD
jgi:hypothetical protein